MRIVAALGGNALQRRGEAHDAAHLDANLAIAADALAGLARAHELVVTHGNGPQVGQLAERFAGEYPLDVLDAETQGMIGYLLDQELANRLPGRAVATLLTRTLVAADDPAWRRPTKPIGAVVDETTAARLAAERGWEFAPDGAGRRRVVASPVPLAVLEVATIALLVQAGAVVVCAGGGGMPVVARGRGHTGVEAVIDKDATSALLGEQLDADLLLLLTDVAGVYDGFGTDAAALVREVTPDALDARALAPGSMGPKARAAATFTRRTGRPSVIGALGDAAALVAGTAGTRCRTVEP